ncbi:hypothetical protein VE00_10779 [Pseudogymnoascus sp. WSF 3629]|nr:hypothetical protein VE00_10779 [Pseudogymnoascus sp. WSF 3629]
MLDIDSYVSFVLRSTHAYDEVVAKRKGKRQTVKGMVQRWRKAQEGREIVHVGGRWRDYYKPGNQKRAQYHQDAMDSRDPSSFTFHPSHPTRHLEIKDQSGVTVAYRLRLPTKLSARLCESEALIPPVKASSHARGETSNRHWAVWKPYMPMPCYSSEYVRDRFQGGDEWLQENSGLFQYLSDVVLRNLNPLMYDKFRGVRASLPPGLEPLCGAWLGCAINQGQTNDGKPHIDTNDYAFGYNVVTTWGTFTSSRLLLWQVSQSIELQPGDAVLFFGRLFTHNAINIVGGERNVVDAFCHSNIFSWHAKQRQQGEGSRAGQDAEGSQEVEHGDAEAGNVELEYVETLFPKELAA